MIIFCTFAIRLYNYWITVLILCCVGDTIKTIGSVELIFNGKLQMRRKASVLADEHFERRLREIENSDRTETVSPVDEPVSSTDSTDLWMEKYRPKNYLDLLSEESVNRTLLHWLKLWDKVVFNREVKFKAPKIEEKPQWTDNKSLNRPEFNKKFDKFKKKTDSELKEELDSLGRPMQRIVLISGPPGLGKTTLAHVVAKHAGMR